jgi:hypothetical protein
MDEDGEEGIREMRTNLLHALLREYFHSLDIYIDETNFSRREWDKVPNSEKFPTGEKHIRNPVLLCSTSLPRPLTLYLAFTARHTPSLQNSFLRSTYSEHSTIPLNHPNTQPQPKHPKLSLTTL